MIVRPIEKGDKEVFFELNKEFYSSNATHRGFDEGLTDKTFEYIISRHENLWGYMIIDKDTKLPIGYALLTSYWCNEDGGNVIILDELYVNYASRHKGYAKKLLDYMEEEFKNKAVSITLEVVTTNIPAKNLYEKLGYTEDGFEVLTKRL